MKSGDADRGERVGVRPARARRREADEDEDRGQGDRWKNAARRRRARRCCVSRATRVKARQRTRSTPIDMRIAPKAKTLASTIAASRRCGATPRGRRRRRERRETRSAQAPRPPRSWRGRTGGLRRPACRPRARRNRSAPLAPTSRPLCAASESSASEPAISPAASLASAQDGSPRRRRARRAASAREGASFWPGLGHGDGAWLSRARGRARSALCSVGRVDANREGTRPWNICTP